MIKVLVVITTEFQPFGGLTTVMMNYYRAIEKDNLHIDFASTNKAPEELINELLKNGSRYYQLPKRKKIFSYYHQLRKLVIDNKYDVVHINGNSSTMLLETLSCGRKVKRIVHVHNTRSNYPFLNNMMKKIFNTSYDKAIAVSKDAGEWLFGGNYIVINNAINLNKYCYKPLVRDEYRKRYGLEKKVVIGTVGKINDQKNHLFMLEVFCEYQKNQEDAILVIVGDGPLRSKLEEKIETLNLKEKVLLLGMRTDASELIQMFDSFLFTSKFEGLGLAVIEAQASGLPCLVSDAVPTETKVSDLIKYYSLEEKPYDWAKRIVTMKDEHRIDVSMKACKSISENGYSIADEAFKLKKIYENI